MQRNRSIAVLLRAKRDSLKRSGVTSFLVERLHFLLKERGFDVRNIRAVTHRMGLENLRPLDTRRKLEVLPEFTESSDFRRLAVLFKRVRNIAKEFDEAEFHLAEVTGTPSDQFLAEPAELALLQELQERKPIIEASIASGEDYRLAFTEAAKFGPAGRSILQRRICNGG